MKKLIAILLILASPALAVRNQRKGATSFMNSGTGGATQTGTLNAAATWATYYFISDAAKTLNKVRVRVSAVTGTLTDLRMEIVADIAGSASAAVTVQDAGDTVTLAAHPFSNGDKVRFNATANGITAETDYWVCNKAATTFQIDATSAACGAIVPITSNGSNNVRKILDVSTTVTAIPAAAAWLEFTGFTTALAAGTQYRIILQNLTATPASNYPTLIYSATSASPIAASQGGGNGWGEGSSTNSGSSWTTTAGIIPFTRLEYSDGTFEGLPFESAIASTELIYAAREGGAVFTTPSNTTLNVRGACLALSARTSTPTGLARIRLYNGVTLLDTGLTTWGNGPLTAAGIYCTYFPTTHAITGGSTVRVVLSETSNADDSSKAFRFYSYTIENDANSKALMPFNGTLKQTYTTDSTANPVVFSDTDTLVPPVLLLLDSEGPYANPCVGRVITQ